MARILGCLEMQPMKKKLIFCLDNVEEYSILIPMGHLSLFSDILDVTERWNSAYNIRTP